MNCHIPCANNVPTLVNCCIFFSIFGFLCDIDQLYIIDHSGKWYNLMPSLTLFSNIYSYSRCNGAFVSVAHSERVGQPELVWEITKAS